MQYQCWGAQMEFRNRIVGLVRFSYPALTGFTRQDEDIAAQIAMLHDRERLETRFRFFEALSLPSLKAQSDRGFETLILVGDGFPEWAMERLRAGIADLEGARIVQLPPMQHYPAMQAAFGSLPDDGCSHLTSFRLDDDDAMDIHHIARLRRMVDGMVQVVNPGTSFCIGHNRGLFLDLSGDAPIWTDVTEKLPLGVGLAMCAPVESRENIFRRNHRLLHMFFTTLTEGETHGYIRTVHAGNDSEGKASGQVRLIGEAKLTAVLRKGFPFMDEGFRG